MFAIDTWRKIWGDIRIGRAYRPLYTDYSPNPPHRSCNPIFFGFHAPSRKSREVAEDAQVKPTFIMHSQQPTDRIWYESSARTREDAQREPG